MSYIRDLAVVGIGLGLVLAIGLRVTAAADQSTVSADEVAIRQTSAAYVAALRQGDAKAVAAFWTTDGVYIDAAGRSLKARDLINEQLGQDAATEKDAQVGVESDSSIRFVTPGVAVEEGTVRSASASGVGDPAGSFTAIWVKKDRGWRLDSVREWKPPAREQTSRLNPLAWMIGDWIGQGDGFVVKCSADWSEKRRFIVRRFVVERDSGETLRGTQRIGWDPNARAIRSWVFDSDGGIVEGRWRRDGNSWIVKTTGVLPDGSESSAVNFWVPEGDQRCVLKSSHVLVGDASMEDSVVEFTRTSAAR
jgi:uncharacterized protein (TIGR02246 family)